MRHISLPLHAAALGFALSLALLFFSTPLMAQTSREVLAAIEKVNDTWQEQHSPYCRAFWDNAAYFTGNMEAYRLTGNSRFYEYSDRWCRNNNWRGAGSDNKREWKYQGYGEGDDFVLFGDWQVCFQTYLDMNNLVPAPYKTARALEVMTYECHLDDNKFWWWADALYMAMPIMTKLYRLTGDRMFLDKLYENYLWSDSLMWDSEAQLYYRDGKYIWPKVTTACGGGKSFWARGDGWVLAGLAKVLADMPEDYEHRDFFLTRYRQLAEGVAACQQEAGYWSRSMLCEEDAPGPETSGTAFFCYALEWGVNHGYLSRETYDPVIEKAWSYLYHTALQEDGTIGYVQPIGEKPDPTRVVDAHSQAPFGTGAWLLAACERVRYMDRRDASVQVSIENPSNDNRGEVVELDAQRIFDALGIGGGRQIVVLDGDGVEQPYQLTHDGKLLLRAFVRPSSSALFTIRYGEPKDYRLDANGRLYPNREDDLAFENDKNAWRLYGPKMHGQGVSGFDVFTKNVTYPILDQLYNSELTSYGINERLKKQGRGGEWAKLHRDVYTYHRNHGQGMDAYTVGATLGAGAPALMDGDKLRLPDVYEKAEILDNGPLRFTVRETMYEQEGVRETRLISLDCGTHLARIEVSYEGVEEGAPLCSGIVLHEPQTEAYVIDKKAGYIAYADALDTPQGQNGELYIACLYPPEMKPRKMRVLEGEGAKHVIGQTTYTASSPFVYYCGTAWSRYDVPSMAVWQTLLEGYADRLRQPLIPHYDD